MINVLKICIIIGIAVFNEETFSGKQTLHKMRPRYFATYEDSPPPPSQQDRFDCYATSSLAVDKANKFNTMISKMKSNLF